MARGSAPALQDRQDIDARRVIVDYGRHRVIVIAANRRIVLEYPVQSWPGPVDINQQNLQPARGGLSRQAYRDQCLTFASNRRSDSNHLVPGFAIGISE